MTREEKQLHMQGWMAEHPRATHEAVADELAAIGMTMDEVRALLRVRGVPIVEREEIEAAQQKVVDTVEGIARGNRPTRMALLSLVLARMAMLGLIDLEIVLQDARSSYRLVTKKLGERGKEGWSW